MPFKTHGRQYDLVVFGATGYTGKLTAEFISTHTRTDLKWAVAGRSPEKLRQVARRCKELDPDREQPAIETCTLSDEDVDALAAKTFILMTTVGPYAQYGEPAFRACAQHGTHYLDVTGEIPWVRRMIIKYEDAARRSGALMFPQTGIDSAPSDLMVWSLAKVIREEFHAATGEVTVSMHEVKGRASGGTLATILNAFSHFTLSEIRASFKPFALSPIKPQQVITPKQATLLRRGITRLTGLVNVPVLGLHTTCPAESTDGAIVQRSWGLLSAAPPSTNGSVPAQRGSQFYGENFAFRMHLKTGNWFLGMVLHWAFITLGFAMAVPPLRTLVRRLIYQPGEGPTAEEAAKQFIEYRAVAKPDFSEGARAQETENGNKKLAYGRARYSGALYYFTGVLMTLAALTILEEDHLIREGGVYTPACLGQGYVDRLSKTGFSIQTKALETLAEI